MCCIVIRRELATGNVYRKKFLKFGHSVSLFPTYGHVTVIKIKVNLLICIVAQRLGYTATQSHLYCNAYGAAQQTLLGKHWPTPLLSV